MACLWVSRHGLDWESALFDNVSAVVGAGRGMIARFWAFRRVVSKRHLQSRMRAWQESPDPHDVVGT